MAWIAYLRDEDATPEQQTALEEVLAERGAVSDFARTLAHSPSGLRAYEAFSRHIRKESPLEQSLRELVILRVSQRFGNEFEWRRHAPMALQVGVDAEKLAALEGWRESGAFSARERCALALVDDFLDEHRPGDDTMRELTAAFEPAELVELQLLVGFYLLVAAVIVPLGLIDDDTRPPAPVSMRA